jgi:hypothetical protein
MYFKKKSVQVLLSTNAMLSASIACSGHETRQSPHPMHKASFTDTISSSLGFF